MTNLSRTCVFFCFVSITVAIGRLDDDEWKTQVQKRMEEMFQMIQRQQLVIDVQTKTIESQAVEIKDLQSRLVALEGRSESSDYNNERLPDKPNDKNKALSNEKQLLRSKGIIILKLK